MGMKARANVATFFKYFVLIFMGFIMVYPLLWMVGSTFMDEAVKIWTEQELTIWVCLQLR